MVAFGSSGSIFPTRRKRWRGKNRKCVSEKKLKILIFIFQTQPCDALVRLCKPWSPKMSCHNVEAYHHRNAFVKKSYGEKTSNGDFVQRRYSLHADMKPTFIYFAAGVMEGSKCT
jgi:hypothetical protein